MPDWKPKPAADGSISTGVLLDGPVRCRWWAPPATIAPFGYLTPQAEFGDIERGNPLPYTLPPERRREVGLERETWRLEVVADPASNTRLEHPGRGHPPTLLRPADSGSRRVRFPNRFGI